ncbi:hypothetical protein HOLleu_17574 [Holothuria leucospilota]|uniref:Uncharacterized protein n=1 Tax=Holothuria leucospilota TaxID=206669 RepID=A0A9Q1C1V6_HOLLE|nr:hypothetical protein HOLleu_17574 [Holothuria leucospilota]
MSEDNPMSEDMFRCLLCADGTTFAYTYMEVCIRTKVTFAQCTDAQCSHNRTKQQLTCGDTSFHLRNPDLGRSE